VNIGFDAKRIVCNGSGPGNYGRTLINDLSEIVDKDIMLSLYAPDEGREPLRAQVKDSQRIRFVYPEHRWLKALWRSRSIVKDLQRDHIDIYHGLSGELPIGIRQSGIKSVVTIHDLIFMRNPEYYHWWDAKIYAAKFHKTVKEADRIIAISECTKRDIVELGGVNPDRIDVIYQSYGATFRYPANDEKKQEVKARYLLPPRYIINVGTIEERKNILLAVKAMELLPKDLSLVIVGRSTSYAQQVKHYVDKHHLGDRVLFLHNVTNDDLPAIYQMAEVCAYPSRYEGFGIPVIEAIHSGLPVVACTGSCLEEAGGPDCLYVNPDDVQGMAESICQLLHGAEGREQRILRAQDYIRRFEGNNVAEQVLRVYKSLIR